MKNAKAVRQLLCSKEEALDRLFCKLAEMDRPVSVNTFGDIWDSLRFPDDVVMVCDAVHAVCLAFPEDRTVMLMSLNALSFPLEKPNGQDWVHPIFVSTAVISSTFFLGAVMGCLEGAVVGRYDGVTESTSSSSVFNDNLVGYLEKLIMEGKLRRDFTDKNAVGKLSNVVGEYISDDDPRARARHVYSITKLFKSLAVKNHEFFPPDFDYLLLHRLSLKMFGTIPLEVRIKSWADHALKLHRQET